MATAAESLRLTKLRYTGGEATVLEVVDAENAYVSSGKRARGWTRALRRRREPPSKRSRERCEEQGTRELREQGQMMSETMNANTTRRARCDTVGRCWRCLSRFLPGCKNAAAPPTQVTVQAEHPQQGPIAEQITADAILAPIAQAAIAPNSALRSRSSMLSAERRCKQGELLVTLENADLAAAAMDNKGSLEAAQAAYATATKAQVPEDTLKAESDLAAAKANLDLNQSIVNSRKQLFAEGAIPGRDLDTAEAALVQAQAAYDAAAKHLESVRSVSREAALKAAQGQSTSAEGKYNGAEAQVNYSEIRSPIDGVVTDRPLFAGETAPAGAPLITVMDTSVAAGQDAHRA